MRSFASKESAGRPAAAVPRSPVFLGSSNSSAERDADRVSERVMDARPRDGQSLRGKPTNYAAPEPQAHRELFPNSGKPLDAPTRSQMESRFHFDFSRVRIHHDEAADRAASTLSARAFTLGSDIAFGQGEYAPQTPKGERLLAHELAHVVQQAHDPAPVLRRAPALNAKHYFAEGDAPSIDKAIAASPIKNYVPVKDWKTLAGNVDQELPAVFAEQYRKYGQSEDDVDSVPGFVNRAEKKPIKLRAPGTNEKNQPVVASNVEHAVHETIHLNSQTTFQSYFGHPCNEGVTEYFTEMALGGPGQAYRDQLSMAKGFMAAFGTGGEAVVAKAYFHGASDLFNRIAQAFGTANSNRDLRGWQKKMQSKDPADWQQANTLLANALKKSGSATAAQPPKAPPQPAPSSPHAQESPKQ
jgi:hypothetical protein